MTSTPNPEDILTASVRRLHDDIVQTIGIDQTIRICYYYYYHQCPAPSLTFGKTSPFRRNRMLDEALETYFEASPEHLAEVIENLGMVAALIMGGPD